MSGSFYLDTNVLIAMFETDGPAHDALWEFVNVGVAAQGISFHVSALAFAELLVKPYRNKDRALSHQYLSLAKSEDWIVVHAVDPTVIEIAASIRARLKLRLPDAIHLATATTKACSRLLTFDVGIPDLALLEHPLSGKLLGSPVTVIRHDPDALAALSKAFS